MTTVAHPDDLVPIGRELRKLASGEVRTLDHTARLLRRDGGLIWVLANASPVQDASGAPLYFLVYIRDVTERKNLEEQLRQAQKMEAVGQLAGGVAHDFNNLLTAIIGNAELLLRAIEPEDPRRLDVLEINRAAHRAATLVRQLLAFSRKQVLQPRVVDLNTVVTDLSTMLRRLIGEHVELRLELQPELGRVLADPGQLEQVITNLAVNARDAMPSGGTLTIRTADVDAAEVPGAEPRVHAAGGAAGGADRARRRRRDGRAHPGAPLRAVLHHQGARPGHGPGPRHRLRHRASERRAHPGEQPAAPREHLHHLSAQSGRHRRARGEELPGWSDQPRAAGTVLVVEDEVSVRRLACRVLRARGYQVLEAGDGRRGPAAAAASTRGRSTWS